MGSRADNSSLGVNRQGRYDRNLFFSSAFLSLGNQGANTSGLSDYEIEIGSVSITIRLLPTTPAFRRREVSRRTNQLIMEIPDPQTASGKKLADAQLHPELQSVLEYAREHDLLGDLDVDPLSELAHPSDLVRKTIPITNADGLTSDDNLTELLIPGAVKTNIPWNVSSAQLAKLQSICQTTSDDELERLAKQMCQLGRAKALKLELPALRSDHGFDYRQMCASIEAARAVSIADHRLPLEPTDVEKDEGLAFPSAAWHCGEMLIQQIQKETIDVSKGAFRYLTEQLKDDLSDEQRWEVLHGQISYTRVSAYLVASVEMPADDLADPVGSSDTTYCPRRPVFRLLRANT